MPQHIVEVLEGKGYRVSEVPFVEEEVYVAYKDFSFHLSDKLKDFSVQLCFFLKPNSSEKKWGFSQQGTINLPFLRMVSPIRRGLLKAVLNTIIRAIRGVVSDIPIATEITENKEEVLDEAKDVYNSAQVIPEETTHLDTYVEVPVVVTKAPLFFTSKLGSERPVNAVLINLIFSNKESAILIVNECGLGELIENMEREIVKRLNV